MVIGVCLPVRSARPSRAHRLGRPPTGPARPARHRLGSAARAPGSAARAPGSAASRVARAVACPPGRPARPGSVGTGNASPEHQCGYRPPITTLVYHWSALQWYTTNRKHTAQGGPEPPMSRK
jgi:hypothetical protein